MAVQWLQAYQKKKDVGELKGDVRNPGPLETFAEVIEEEGILVGVTPYRFACEK